MKQHRAVQAAMIISVAVILGCVEPARVTSSPERHDSKLVDDGGTAERQALTELTRAVALALNDPNLRSQVKVSMREAPFVEHKLELRNYLTPALLNSIAARSGINASKLSSDIQIVRPLELYVPVAAHRASWTGGPELLVVSQLEDSSRMIAFNVRGEEVLVSRDAPPSVPTLTIVPKETRFDKPLSAAEWRNQDDANGLAIGTLVRRNVGVRHLEECGDGCQGGGGSYGYQPPGAYMTFSRLFDLHEPWTKGNPEIEVHVHGPPSGGNSNYGADLSCSGEHALGERSFDQNGSWWNGDVLIWTGAQETTFATEFPNGYHILFWEDDDTPCVIKTDAPVVRQTIAAIAGAGIGIAFKFITTGPVAAGFALGTWLAGDVLSAEWVTTNDDFVGTLAFPAPGDIFPYNDANYWIRDSNGVTGRANFIFR